MVPNPRSCSQNRVLSPGSRSQQCSALLEVIVYIRKVMQKTIYAFISGGTNSSSMICKFCIHWPAMARRDDHEHRNVLRKKRKTESVLFVMMSFALTKLPRPSSTRLPSSGTCKTTTIETIFKCTRN